MTDLPTGTVTFLFTDIEGSTRLARELSEDWRPTVEEHNRLLREAIRTAGGIDVRTEGDAFFAVFSSAPAAVAAAAAAQRSVAAASWPRPVRVRMGLHTGEGVLGGDEYVGVDVHLAARVAAAGHGGQVLLSQATRALVEHALPSGASLRDLGEHRLKDFPEGQRLYQLDVGELVSEFPPLRTLEVPTNLPAQRTSFVGRAEEIRTLVGLVRAARLVTLLGPGGTGKTRLAIRVAEEALPSFDDGAFFVDLSTIRDPALVPAAIARGLGLLEDPARSPLDVAAAFLAGREVLLVLDNFEQVIEAAPVVDRLLEAGPGIVAVATSRLRLGVAGEHAFDVAPLEPPASDEANPERLAANDAAALFVDRAGAVRAGFTLGTDNADAVAEICARVEGLPLAIELAAVQVRVLSPAEIAARLRVRVGALGSGPRTAPERQRTLAATIAWSHELLAPPHRTLFSRLAAFPAGATLQAVEAVCDPNQRLGAATLDMLTELVDHSLVQAVETPDGSRYRMLEPIREFALERLEESDAADVRQRLAAFLVDLAERAAPHLTGWDRETWLDRLEREHGNIQAAMRWSIEADRGDVGLRLAAALWRFWQIRGHVREARPVTSRVLAMPSSSGATPERVGALLAAGSMAYWHDDIAGARAPYEEAVSLARSVGDRALIAEALFHLAYVEGLEGRFDVADRLLSESARIRAELGDRRGLGWVDVARSHLLGIQGRPEETVEMLEAALPVFLEAGDQFGVDNVHGALAAAAYRLGNLDRAEELMRATLAGTREWAANAGVAIAGLASLALARDEAERAVRLWGAFEGLQERYWGDAHPPWALLPLGDTRAEAAARLPEEAAAAAREEGRRMSLEDAVRYAVEG